MGKLIWSQWAKLIALVAGVFETIGGIFGIFYRIATFEDVTSIFNADINPVNIVSIVCIPLGLIILAIETPVFPFKDTFVSTSYAPRISLYMLISTFSIVNYQNVNPALYLFIATLMYIVAAVKGEARLQMKQNSLKSKMVV
ncbi:9501_t:CDS:2 [Acaulospora morrowiae]|uniref:9501_t:CDS:1 n=1 Tax=Acaulospora morrowiae TaxID=94023 RepID=A0A9N9A4M8_9GLOM|nr:9501_t:CDS:2 [Acaulospora morrowiae]